MNWCNRCSQVLDGVFAVCVVGAFYTVQCVQPKSVLLLCRHTRAMVLL